MRPKRCGSAFPGSPASRRSRILGEQESKIYVEISYKRLATLGVTAPDLFRALETQNDVTPSGFVETAGPRVYLRLDGGIDGVEAVKAIPVASGGNC